jgi:hypothetical protein
MVCEIPECYRTPLGRPCLILRVTVSNRMSRSAAAAICGQYSQFQTRAGQNTRPWAKAVVTYEESEIVATIAALTTFYYLVANMARGFGVSRTSQPPGLVNVTDK